jgi:hypothetical protein
LTTANTASTSPPTTSETPVTLDYASTVFPANASNFTNYPYQSTLDKVITDGFKIFNIDFPNILLSFHSDYTVTAGGFNISYRRNTTAPGRPIYQEKTL